VPVPSTLEPMTDTDGVVIEAQLGRPARGVVGVWRCPCGKPAVVATKPRLDDGTPFPTHYYLTCPRAIAGCSSLEAAGVMAQMTERLGQDSGLAAAYRRAHDSYLHDREWFGRVAELSQVSAGGMPDRVKCLHALVAHALVAGPGVNPFGDEALDDIGQFWLTPCLEERR
jgi:hypothetical protein